MAVHFSECEVKNGKADMTITLEEVQHAIKILGTIEPRMHLALNFKKRNPLAEATDSILETLKKQPGLTRVELLSAAWESLPNGEESLDMITKFLEDTNRIRADKKDMNGRTVHVYFIHSDYLKIMNGEESTDSEPSGS